MKTFKALKCEVESHRSNMKQGNIVLFWLGDTKEKKTLVEKILYSFRVSLWQVKIG